MSNHPEGCQFTGESLPRSFFARNKYPLRQTSEGRICLKYIHYYVSLSSKGMKCNFQGAERPKGLACKVKTCLRRPRPNRSPGERGLSDFTGHGAVLPPATKLLHFCLLLSACIPSLNNFVLNLLEIFWVNFEKRYFGWGTTSAYSICLI